MELTQRSALGQTYALGSYYNARTEEFVSANLLKPGLQSGAIETSNIPKVDIHLGKEDAFEKQFEAQFEAMGIGAGLGVSILAGLAPLKGSSAYLNEKPRSRALHAALYYTVTTISETLNLRFTGLQDCLALDQTPNSEVTHIVTKIEWGMRSIISARQYLTPTSNIAEAKSRFEFDTVKFLSAVELLQRTEHHNAVQPSLTETHESMEITVYSDILGSDGIIMEHFQEASDFLHMMPLHIRNENGGKGMPIMYSLLPIEILDIFLSTPRIFRASKFISPPADCLTSFIRLFDDYQTSQRILDDLKRNVLVNERYLPPDLLQIICDRRRKSEIAEQTMKSQLAQKLQAVRSGSDPTILRQLLVQHQQNEFSPKTLGNIGAPYRKSTRFITKAVSKGAVYLGYNGLSLDQILPRQVDSEAYVLYFSPSAMEDDSGWPANQDLLFELLQNRDAKSLVAIVDCEATKDTLEKVRIAYHQGGQEVSSDYLEHKQFMADKCFAQCNEQTLETRDIQKPIQRRHVTIPCPGSKCTRAEVREWLCPRCEAPIEYGFSDQYIYCDCSATGGRSLYTNYVFKCNSNLHGPNFVPYDPDQLLRLLQGLVQSNYLNILILGETGVGKSTFINALVNYLEFETLNEAMSAEKLNYVIPCSFSTQFMDRTDPSKPIEEKRIMVGARDDEQDGSTGNSATQRTTVYPVTFNTGDSALTVRLIDTPGMGDTRGPEFDRTNMADILSTLRGYDKVHGILILLKSNASRLTILFRYCIKEILTQLHQDAAKNMAFGFTNTRISNYTPGDTYLPLKMELQKNPGIGLDLSIPTTYCFDSESFRYLAAYKSGTEMQNKEDFDRSWNHSRRESIRLIDHFKANIPHLVKSTISLNGVRQVIAELTKPMAEISQSIRANIALTMDKVQELKDTRLSGDQLRNRLNVQKIQMNTNRLDQPRTVCSHKSCIEVKSNGKAQNESVTDYKAHCHPVCSLNDVNVDQLAHPGLIHCWAFSRSHGQRSDTCRRCGHHWQQHLHILYELSEETVTVEDTAIVQQLKAHANDVTLRETALRQHEQRIKEYEQERNTIRDAAAKFGVYLRKNSLAPYNDALIAYLDYLIKEEQVKVQVGSSDKRLQSLLEERRKHQEAIEVITRNQNSNVNTRELSDDRIKQKIQDLYHLKHFGAILKNMQQGIAMAHEATYRERPYTVRRRNARMIVQVRNRTQELMPQRLKQNNPFRGSTIQAITPAKHDSSVFGSLIRKVPGIFS